MAIVSRKMAMIGGENEGRHCWRPLLVVREFVLAEGFH